MQRCAACHFPVSVSEGEVEPYCCSQCAMIAKGQKYRDGSDPAEGLSKSEVEYIRMRVDSIAHAQKVRKPAKSAKGASLADWDRIIQRSRKL